MSLGVLNDWARQRPPPRSRGKADNMLVTTRPRLERIKVAMDELDHLKQTELEGSAAHRIPEAEEVQDCCLVQFGRKAEETSAACIDGVWTGEILGLYGWENTGTYILEQGRILGGNHRHYSAGYYSSVDESYRAEIVLRYMGGQE